MQFGGTSSLGLTQGLARRGQDDRVIAFWLLFCCAMMFLMVVIGGITRLTESGLSITEWQPITGVLPPLNEGAWHEAFDKYKAIPQYRAIHPSMGLGEFKEIYFWEYLHRLWGRLIGVVFALPFLYFLLRGRVARPLVPRLLVLLLLGGLQGALGWFMVQSGLAGRIEVSQYRLAAHLLAAVLIYGAMLWVALDLLWPRLTPGPLPVRRAARGVVALVLLTLTAGAFVAGLRAGYIDNTFPLMDGGLVPPDYGQLAPWYRNFFENAAAAQFDHRLLAELTWVAAVALWLWAWRFEMVRSTRLALHLLLGVATLQVGLGIATLVLVVPLPLAVLHQAGAMLLLTVALVLCQRLAAPRVDGRRARAL